MKKCGRCKVVKELSEFNKNKTKSDGLQVVCKTCGAATSAKHYSSNKQDYKKSKNKSISILREYVLDFLKTNHCVDCAESDPICLDFDHVSGVKLRNIAQLIHAGVALDTLKSEMEKCVVRCSNCHRKKTAKDFNWFKYRESKNYG